LLAVGIDQLTKRIAVDSLERGESANVFLGLDVTNTRNSGVAFGALQGKSTLIGLLIGVALLALLAYFVVHARQPWLWLPVGLILGGAAGNLIDRAHEGAVIDFVDPIAWPAFNLADAFIVAGVFALLFVVEARPGEE
jgi:signal peptidase II